MGAFTSTFTFIFGVDDLFGCPALMPNYTFVQCTPETDQKLKGKPF